MATEQELAAAGSGDAAAADPLGAEQPQAEVAALQERCQLAEAELQVAQEELAAAQAERAAVAGEVAHLRQQLQQRDAEVAQLRLQVGTASVHLHWRLVGRLLQVSASGYCAEKPGSCCLPCSSRTCGPR